MNKEIIEKTVKEITAEQFGVVLSKIKPETSFAEDLKADSLDAIEVVMEFEEKFGLSIPDGDAQKIATVGNAIDYIEKNIGKNYTPK